MRLNRYSTWNKHTFEDEIDRLIDQFVKKKGVEKTGLGVRQMIEDEIEKMSKEFFEREEFKRTGLSEKEPEAQQMVEEEVVKFRKDLMDDELIDLIDKCFNAHPYDRICIKDALNHVKR